MDQTLLKHLDNFLLGSETVEDIEVWLTANLDEILDSRDALLVDLANNLESDLIEYGEDVLNEETLRDRIHSYYKGLTTIVNEASSETSVTEVGSSTETLNLKEDYSHSTTLYPTLSFV